MRARVRSLLDERLARARDLVRRERETLQRAAAVLAAEGHAGPDPSRQELVQEGYG